MFNAGDTVRIGKGKVEYVVHEVQSAPEGKLTVQSNNTGKVQDVEVSRLTLVKAHELSKGERFTKGEVELWTTTKKPYMLQVDGVVEGFKSFEAAAFALSRVKVHSYAAIDYKGARKVERVA